MTCESLSRALISYLVDLNALEILRFPQDRKTHNQKCLVLHFFRSCIFRFPVFKRHLFWEFLVQDILQSGCC